MSRYNKNKSLLSYPISYLVDKNYKVKEFITGQKSLDAPLCGDKFLELMESDREIMEDYYNVRNTLK